jgi:hypothetical protein
VLRPERNRVGHRGDARADLDRFGRRAPLQECAQEIDSEEEGEQDREHDGGFDERVACLISRCPSDESAAFHQPGPRNRSWWVNDSDGVGSPSVAKNPSDGSAKLVVA